jgi:hypothetical protein
MAVCQVRVTVLWPDPAVLRSLFLKLRWWCGVEWDWAVLRTILLPCDDDKDECRLMACSCCVVLMMMLRQGDSCWTHCVVHGSSVVSDLSESLSVDLSPSWVDAYASRASLICPNQANFWSCDVCRSWGREVCWMRALSWGRSSVSRFCHSCVTLSLSSPVGILSTPVRSWSVSFRYFQIVQLNSHSASVRFLAQKEHYSIVVWRWYTLAVLPQTVWLFVLEGNCASQ